MTQDYVALGVLIVAGIAFFAFAVIASDMLGRRRSASAEQILTEDGTQPIAEPPVRFRVGYFVYALMLLVFDVGVVFLYLWAVVFHRMGAFVLIQMVVFAGVLVSGLVYAWKEGALEWR